MLPNDDTRRLNRLLAILAVTVILAVFQSLS